MSKQTIKHYECGPWVYHITANSIIGTMVYLTYKGLATHYSVVWIDYPKCGNILSAPFPEDTGLQHILEGTGKGFL